MLVNMIDLLNRAKESKTAVLQLNINNLEWTKYILETCQELQSPIILGVSESAIKHIGGYTTVVNLVVGLMIDLKVSVPVVLHLDHGSSFDSCRDAIDAGFTSVMIDQSKKSLQENILVTSEVVKYAYKYKVSVEGELGIINTKTTNTTSSNVEDCVKYASSTGIDALAPAVGNAHGIYNIKPKLDFKRIKEISDETGLPLVLHGGTGISEEDIKKCIECGITKININTELQLEWAKGLREYLKVNKEVYDPRKIISSGEQNMKTKIAKIIALLNKNR